MYGLIRYVEYSFTFSTDGRTEGPTRVVIEAPTRSLKIHDGELKSFKGTKIFLFFSSGGGASISTLVGPSVRPQEKINCISQFELGHTQKTKVISKYEQTQKQFLNLTQTTPKAQFSTRILNYSDSILPRSNYARSLCIDFSHTS